MTKLLLKKNTYNNLLIFLFMLMFLNYAGYGYYVFFIPFIAFISKNGLKGVDGTFYLFFIFGLLYGVTNYLNSGRLAYADTLITIINFPCLYLVGKYISRNFRQTAIVDILFAFSLALAIIPILSVFKDISDNGFYVVGLTRNIPLIGINSGNETTNATNITSTLMFLDSFVVFLLLPYKIKKKILYIICSIISLYCAIRLQSRTTLLVMTFLLLIIFMITWKTKSYKYKVFLIFVLISIVWCLIYIYDTYSTELAILDRLDDVESMQSGGGRLDLKEIVISNLSEYPFGNMPRNIEYAHDLWLDCARHSGLFPFFLLLVLTILYLKNFFYFLINKRNLFIFKITVFSISVSMFSVFLAEPVLEGDANCFAFYSLIFGLIRQQNLLKLKYKLS